MRRSVVSALTLAVALISAPATFAQDAEPEAAVTAQPANPLESQGDDAPDYWDEVLCRAGPRTAPPLRSRERICQTRRAWREYERRLEEVSRNMPHRNRTPDRQPNM